MRDIVKVRDKTKKRSEYKGRITDARDELCPCRSCYNAHDCGHLDYRGKQLVHMACATRWNNGCPQPLPEPEHIFKSEKANICKRCGFDRRCVKK